MPAEAEEGAQTVSLAGWHQALHPAEGYFWERQVESQDFHLRLTATSRPQVGIGGDHMWTFTPTHRSNEQWGSTLSPEPRHRKPLTQRVSEPEYHNKNSKYATETPYLLLKYFGQRGTVCQFNEPHHIGHRPLQGVALQNQSLPLLLLYFLQREEGRKSFYHHMVGGIL